MLKAIFSFSPFFIIVGCKQTETKKIFGTFANGQAKEVRYYDNPDDSLTYRKESFFSNGAEGYTGKVVKGKKSGIWTWWYANGNKKDQCKYSDGFEVDTIYHWDKNGTIHQIQIIREGHRISDSCKCNGTIIWYYDNGKPKEMFTNIDEIQQDTAKSWYDNGQLKSYSFYKDGKEEGISETFYRNGQKEKSGTLMNGLIDGKMTTWDSLGKIISVTNYKMGKIED
jgi:antitoxin component YwqK of YwqJK toxin-antitoxin module